MLKNIKNAIAICFAFMAVYLIYDIFYAYIIAGVVCLFAYIYMSNSHE